MTDKELYRIICEENDIPLMAQYRWMEAVSIGKDWDVLIVWRDDDGQREPSNVAAALPYHIFQKYGIKMIVMPQLTQITSVYVHPEVEREKILPLVVSRLDMLCKTLKYACCILQGYFDAPLRESFEREKYSLCQRISLRIGPITERATLISGYNVNRKRNLKKAEGVALITLSVDDFYSFHSLCLRNRGKKISYSRELLANLISTLQSSGQAEIWGAVNEQSELLAATVTVSDGDICYYLLPSFNWTYRQTGAMTWLTTKLILKAGERGQVFDFEGSMIPSIARAYGTYGAKPVTYYRVEKFYNPAVGLLFRLKTFFSK